MNPTAPSPVQRLQAISQAREWVMEGKLASHSGVPDWVVHSWQHCLGLGMRPNDRVEFEAIDSAQLKRLKAQHLRLREAAQDELARLSRTISGSQYFALLTDAQGVVVDVAGNPNQRDRRVHAIARLGVDLSESRIGTSAIGAALAHQRPVWLHRGEHFFNDTSVYSCAGAPIAGPDGQCLGMLDLTGVMALERPELQHLVAQSARSIETALLRAHPHRLVMRLNWPGRLRNDDTDACLLLDDEGFICARNSLATQLLQLPAGLVPLTDVFAASEGQIHDMQRSNTPLELPLWSGLTVQCLVQPSHAMGAVSSLPTPEVPDLQETGALKRVQDSMIHKALQAAKGNVVLAAKTLGISRATLYRRLSRRGGNGQH